MLSFIHIVNNLAEKQSSFNGLCIYNVYLIHSTLKKETNYYSFFFVTMRSYDKNKKTKRSILNIIIKYVDHLIKYINR